nr:hypothetical protein [Devosia aurantiaca]
MNTTTVRTSTAATAATSVKARPVRLSYEGALFALVIGNIHGFEQSLDPGAGAPERNGKRHEECPAERGVLFADQAGQLVLQNFKCAGRHDAYKKLHLVQDAGAVVEEAVERDEGREGRDERQ